MGFGQAVLAVEKAQRLTTSGDARLSQGLTELGSALAGGQTGEPAAKGFDLRRTVHAQNTAQVGGRMFLQFFGAFDPPQKCVGVCPDDDFRAATRFLAQYGPWDEDQIGAGAFAEICLRYRWAGIESGGTPRIMVFRDQDSYDAQRAHGTVKRLLVGDYALGSQLKEWIEAHDPGRRPGKKDNATQFTRCGGRSGRWRWCGVAGIQGGS